MQQKSLLNRYIRLRACLAHLADRIRETGGVVDDRRDDLLAGDVDHRTCLDIDDLRILLVLDLLAAHQLGLCIDTEPLKELDRLLGGQGRNRIHHGRKIRKTSALCLLYPLLGVAVSVKDDALVLRQELLDVIMTCIAEVLCLLQYVGGFLELLCDDGIEDDVRTCDGLGRTHHTELELVTGKGKR